MTPLPLSRTYRRVVLLELNEVTRAILDRLELPIFSSLNEHFARIDTTSEETTERCEPWVQWPSIHTGLTLDQHRVFRLGERPAPGVRQTWEILSDAGVTSAILGPINGRRGSARGGIFLPDPWGDAREVDPPTVGPLWDALHQLAQRHSPQPLSASPLIDAVATAFGVSLSEASRARCRADFDLAVSDPRQRWRVASAMDQLLFEAFERILATTSHAFVTLYLNSVAHYQHHFWRQFDSTPFPTQVDAPDCAPGDDPIRHGYAAFDALVQRLLALRADPHTLILIATGLSQSPLIDRERDRGVHQHRVRDHAAFLAALGLRGAVASPLMSRDWRIDVDSDASRTAAHDRLASMTVSGAPLFEVVADRTGGLFVWTATECAHAKDARILVENRDFGAFDDWFVVSAIKSGGHVGEGSLWSSDLAMRAVSQVPVTAIHSTVLRALGVE